MDWYVIQYLYPTALNRFCNTMFPNVGVPCVSVLEFYDIKKLYHFFDKQGIYLTVEMITRGMWVYMVSLDNGKVIAPSHDSKKKREDIEVEGFYKCFQLLESKLRNSYI